MSNVPTSVEPGWSEKLRAGMPKREFQRLLTKDISTADLRELLAEREASALEQASKIIADSKIVSHGASSR
jgi:hypothetical protein